MKKSNRPPSAGKAVVTNSVVGKFIILAFRTDDVFFGYWLGKNEKVPFESLGISNPTYFENLEVCNSEMLIARDFCKVNSWSLNFKAVPSDRVSSSNSVK